ncbi:MAG: flagellar hook-length control protein FliK [Oligoflexales bacterium]|nr:flagellar hook-length control protein FliK [Oligoflexales bacterium]
MIDGFLNQKNLQKSSNAVSEPILSARNDATNNRKEAPASNQKQFSKHFEEQPEAQAANQKQSAEKDQKASNSNPMSQLAESGIKSLKAENQELEGGKKEGKDSEVVTLLGGFDVVAQAVPSLALLSGRLELMDKQELVDLVSGDNVIGKALSTDSLPMVLQTQAPIEFQLKELGFNNQQITKLAGAGFDLAATADMQSVLEELGVNPAKAVAELTQLKNTISQQGLTPYFEKMSAHSIKDSATSIKNQKTDEQLAAMQTQTPGKSPAQAFGQAPGQVSTPGSAKAPSTAQVPASPVEKQTSSKSAASMPAGQNANSVVGESRDRSDEPESASSQAQQMFSECSPPNESINTEIAVLPIAENQEFGLESLNKDSSSSSIKTDTNVLASNSLTSDFKNDPLANNIETPLALVGFDLPKQQNKDALDILSQNSIDQAVPILGAKQAHFLPQNFFLEQNLTQKELSKDSLNTLESESVDSGDLGPLLEEQPNSTLINNASAPVVSDSGKVKPDFSDLARLQFELQTASGKSAEENASLSTSFAVADQNIESVDKYSAQERQAGKELPNFIDFLRNSDTQATNIDAQGKENITAPIENQQLAARIDQVINERMNVLAQQGGGDVRLDLSDDKNGKLEVQLNISGKEVAVQFAAESEKVREFLRSELPSLKQHLQERDLQLTNANVQQQFSQDRQAWSGQNFSDNNNNMKEIKSIKSGNSRARHHLDPIGLFKVPTFGPNSQSISVLV